MRKKEDVCIRLSLTRKELFTLIGTGVTLLVSLSLFLLSAVSFAWFAKKDEMPASGMSVQASAPADLVISENKDLLLVMRQDNAVHQVVWDSGREKMTAASHCGTSGTFLQYVSNPEQIAPGTGMAKSGATLTFADVAEDDASPYYVDFTVYVASVGRAQPDMTLFASLTAAAKNADSSGEASSLTDTHLAATADFFVNGVYCGKLSVAGFSGSTLSLFSGEIPLNTSGFIEVTMRCYFDGALEKSSGQAYVSTYRVDPSELILGVRFTLQEND